MTRSCAAGRLAAARLSTAVAALLSLLALASPAAARSLDEVRASGELIVGTDATYPPFESKVGDAYEGFDIDLLEAVGRRLGVRVRWVNASFDGIFPALLMDRFDAVVSAITITPERQQTLAFSLPYYEAGQIIAVRDGDGRIESEGDLSGRTVGVQINTTAQVLCEKLPDVTVRAYNTIDLAFLDLVNGRIDAVVNDAPVSRYMITKTFTQLDVVGGLLSSEHYGIAMRPEDTALVGAVNEALAAMARDGEYAALHRKWFGVDAVPEALLSGVPTAPPPAKRSLVSFDVLVSALPVLARGALMTILLTLLAFAVGLPVGVAVALLRLSPSAALRALGGVYVEVFRGVPLLVQIFFAYFVLPFVGIKLGELPTGVLALGLNAGAYIAEIVRAGIESVDAGQTEAARSLGMTRRQAMRLVVLPQALRRIVPPLTNEMIALLKDSSLVSIMGMTELTRSGQELASRLANPLTIWPTVAVFYLLMTLPLTRLAARLERRARGGGR